MRSDTRELADSVANCPNCVSAGWGCALRHCGRLTPLLSQRDGAKAPQHSKPMGAADRGQRGALSKDFGGPYPAALECLANSGANLFAAADLTLMRSLRIKNAV